MNMKKEGLSLAGAVVSHMIYSPEMFTGSDNERLQAAIDAAAGTGGQVVVGARCPDETSKRDYWLLDRALLMPSGTTLVLDNCKLKLSDNCRDNFIRSANCGSGISEIALAQDIHITGRGNAVLEGADRPRATGDAGKGLMGDQEYDGTFNVTSYGSDAGKEGVEQGGDWRNIGILMAYVKDFSISNLKVVDSHCWAISLEHCSFGNIYNLRFDSQGFKVIDGVSRPIRNQDGLDLRQGCHDITIDGISGCTGDDMVALTAIRGRVERQAGELAGTMVSGNVPQGAADDVYNIIIRNVRGSGGGNHVVRFLNNGGIVMRSILLDGVIGTAPTERPDRAVVVVGDHRYGGIATLGDTREFMISNIQGNGKFLVEIRGTLADSLISNLIYSEEQVEGARLYSDKSAMRNVMIQNSVMIGRQEQ